MVEVTYKCDYCGKVYTTKRFDTKYSVHFCCKDCYFKYKKENHKSNKHNCTCANCGKTFYRSPSRLIKDKLFCSTSCASSYYMKEKNKKYREDLNCTCTYCGVKFHRKKSHIGKTNFCSKECQNNYHKSKRVEKTCIVCGKKFNVPACEAEQSKFCSVNCHNEYQRRFFLSTKCAYCGKELHVSKEIQSHNKTGNYFCSNTCVGKFFKGSSSPNYTGYSDVTKVLRAYYEANQRGKIFHRDNKTCQICGGVATNVHHIYPIYKMIKDFAEAHPDIDLTKDCFNVAEMIMQEHEKFLDMNNMIAVCECCHKELHHDERTKRWKE